MGERKVVNKYYPPDFDPSKIPRRRQPNNQQINVRNMIPMKIRCSTCGDYLGQGTKFNMRHEVVVGETYLGIKLHRFYFKCRNCSAEIIMKTDPRNGDYVVELGAVRCNEPDQEIKRKRGFEEVEDSMKSLEKRSMDSKKEMEDMAAVDELISMNKRRAKVSSDAALEALHRRKGPVQKEDKLEKEDEALTKYRFQDRGYYNSIVDREAFHRRKGPVQKEEKLEKEDEALTKYRFQDRGYYNSIVDREALGKLKKLKVEKKQEEQPKKRGVRLFRFDSDEDDD